MEKNCDLGLENATLSLRPRAVFSRPRSQFFTIRTSQPANNIYLCTARQCIHHMTCAISPRMKVPVKLEHETDKVVVSPFSFFFCFVFLFCLCFVCFFFFFFSTACVCMLRYRRIGSCLSCTYILRVMNALGNFKKHSRSSQLRLKTSRVHP